MSPLLDLSFDRAFTAATVLVCVGTALHCAELLAIRHEFASDGLLSWQLLRTRHSGLLSSPWCAVVDRLLSYQCYVLWIITNLACVVVVLLDPSRAPLWALGVLVAGRAIFQFRNPPAIIGADQMQSLVLIASLLRLAVPDATWACAWFVSGQLILAYVTAGLWKLTSPEWRSGSAISGVVRTRTMGARRAHAYIAQHPAVATALSWGTILFETFAPWMIFGGAAACSLFLAAGLMFHVGVAIVMGFDEFLWAFLSAYPLALSCAGHLERLSMGG